MNKHVRGESRAEPGSWMEQARRKEQHERRPRRLTMGYTVQSGWSTVRVKGAEKDERREVSWRQILRGPCTAGRKV